MGDKIDPLVQNYLKATRYKGGVVNSLVTIATEKALLKRYPRLEEENSKIERSWAQSLFRRMGFVRRIKTTGKVHIPVGAQKEAELKFLHQIVNQVEKYQGQTTDKIFKVLKDNHILVNKVPANMTHLFQPLDLTVNYTKQKFSDWFTRQINTGLENGQELDDIEIDYRLSVLKPLHAKWLISFYNYMSTTKGKEVISNRWKRSGIYDSITLGSSKLPALDPFSDICPLMEVVPPMETLSLVSLFPQELDSYRWRADDVSDNESEWECDDDTTVCDDDEVNGTNGEVSNADDDGALSVFDLFE